MKYDYDAFICHASEDKDTFVRKLAKELADKDFKIWYDEFTITVGDSLLDKISEGLSKSKYGIVIFSKAFFEKRWTKRELEGLVALEEEGQKKILPIWLNVRRDDIIKHYPTLANLYAADYAKGMDSVIKELLVVLIPEKTDESNRHVEPTVFFDKRISEAFPGIRGLYETTATKEIISRLNILLKEPLQFKGYYPSLMLYDMNGGTSDIGNYKVIDEGKILIDIMEITPRRLIAFRPQPYWQSFVYLESDPDVPTGLYKKSYESEEYAINEKGDLITRSEFDDGFMFRDGRSIPIGNVELRYRSMIPTSLIIASRTSPINRNDFDKHRETFLKDILHGEKSIDDFIQIYERLPRHHNDC